MRGLGDIFDKFEEVLLIIPFSHQSHISDFVHAQQAGFALLALMRPLNPLATRGLEWLKFFDQGVFESIWVDL